MGRRRKGAIGIAVFAIAILGCGGDRRPNLVLVTIDTLRADRLGCYGSVSVLTPSLDRIAAHGVLFADCITPIPETSPKYLSPQVYSQIFTGEQTVGISSKRKKLTIFFSDIADFTETTESLESEELTGLLNRYLTEMTEIALAHGATIDKYIGDAMMLFFGDPESRGVKEDATTCVEMAIAMQRRVRELQTELRDLGLEKPFQLRI